MTGPSGVTYNAPPPFRAQMDGGQEFGPALVFENQIASPRKIAETAVKFLRAFTALFARRIFSEHRTKAQALWCAPVQKLEEFNWRV